MSEERNESRKPSVTDWWEAQSAENKRKWGIGSLAVVAVVMLIVAMGGIPMGSSQKQPRVENPQPVDPFLFGGGRSNARAIEDLDRSLNQFGTRLRNMELRQDEALARLNRVRENFEAWVENTDIERLAIRARRRMETLDEKLQALEEAVENQEYAAAGIQRFDLNQSPSEVRAQSVRPDAQASDREPGGEEEAPPQRPEPPSPQPQPNADTAPQDLFSGTGMTPRSNRQTPTQSNQPEPKPRTGIRINGRSVGELEAERQTAQQDSGAEQDDQVTPTQAGSSRSERVRIDNNLPLGSIASAVLIHGMDAPTGTGSRGQPVPTIARITDLTILPNMQSMDLVDCHVLIAAYGDLSSERAMGRTEDLSCTTADGEIIHAVMQGYIVGPDGNVGVRGPVIHRNGELVVRSVQSGVLSGLGQMFGGRRRGLTISTTGRLAEQDFGEAAEEGIGRGVGTALQNISEYYLKLAESIFPVIKVDAGTPVDIVITGQVELKS